MSLYRQFKTFIRKQVEKLLASLARKLIAKHSPKVVAITGSVGKTSTKRAIAAAVETAHKTQWHDGNYNSEIGLPLALFEIETAKNTYNPLTWLLIIYRVISKLLFWNYPYELLILEFGVDHVGDMDKFLEIVTPDIGVVTAVQGAHLEGMKTLDNVYDEKTKLALRAKSALINTEDELLRDRFLVAHPNTQTYGKDESSTFTMSKPTRTKDKTLSFYVDGHIINTNFVAEHQLLALLAGWAIGSMLEVEPEQMMLGLQELEPYSGRMNLLRGKQGSFILDDSYNNVSVQAAKTAMKTLADFPGKRHILVFGTMNEMGEQTEAGHREAGLFARELNFDYIVTVGGSARGYFSDELVRHGFDRSKIASFLSPYEAGEHLAPLLRSGDIVLVKGSQNKVFTEETTALLLKLDSDRSKLVRQSSGWQKIKHSQFFN